MSQIKNYYKFYQKAGLVIHNVIEGTKNPCWKIEGKEITTYKDLSVMERKERMEKMEDMKTGYAMFTGEQHDGRFILGLDFDIYDNDGTDPKTKEYINGENEETDGEKRLEVLREFKNLCSWKDNCYFNTSTCYNMSMIVDISKNIDLLNFIKDKKIKKIEPIKGFEILCGMNYVLPSTTTECKRCKTYHLSREFHKYNNLFCEETYTVDKKDFNVIVNTFTSKWEAKLLNILKDHDGKEKKPKENKTKEIEIDTKPALLPDVDIKEKKARKQMITEDDVELDEALIKKLLNSLDMKYCNNYDEWLKIGMCIKNLKLPYSLWDNWSKKSKKYKTGCCVSKWESFKDNGKLGLGTLLVYLRNSDFVVYEELEKILSSSYINFACLTPEVYCRQLIYILNNDLIFCGKEKQKQCYKWNGCYWETLDEDYIELKKVIKNDLCKHMIDLLSVKSLKSEYIQNNKNKIGNTIKQYLENSRNYDTIINNLKIELYNKNVKFDQTPYIFQFKNACYDLKADEFTEPDKGNYKTLTCGYDYDFSGKYTKETDHIYKFFKSVLEDNTDFMLTYISMSLYRYNIEQKALFCYGTGRNGKGKIYDLIKNVFGDFASDISMSYFTTYDKNADTPNTNLFDCRDSHIAIASEIDQEGQNNKKTKMVSSKFKKLVGNDTINIRKVFGKDQANFVFGQLMFLLNSLPQMPCDVAMRERVIILQFKYNFVNKPTKPHEKLIDIKLGELFKTNEYRQAFIKILFSYYKKYKTNGLVIPEEVENYTKLQFSKMSEVEMWLMDSRTSPIIKEEGSKVRVSDLHEIYRVDNDISSTAFGMQISKIEDLETKAISGYKYILNHRLKDNGDKNDEKDEYGD